jgi:hypothetical protein
MSGRWARTRLPSSRPLILPYDNLSEQQMRGPLGALADPQGIRSVSGLENCIAGGLETFADQLPQACLIRDEDHCFRASKQLGSRGFLWRHCNLSRVGPRQVDREGRAVTWLAVGKDVPPLRLTIPQTVARPKACPLSGVPS